MCEHEYESASVARHRYIGGISARFAGTARRSDLIRCSMTFVDAPTPAKWASTSKATHHE